MQKFMNDPGDFVDDMLAGVFATHPSLVPGTVARTVVRRDDGAARVTIVTGGGSGHLPLFMGYVGDGLADGAAVGEVFSSPNAEQIAGAIADVDRGAGTLLLFGNYGGDTMNFEMAAELVAEDGIATAIVKATDDVASAPRDARERRRGVAGLTLLYRIAGASALRGDDLEEVARLASHANEALASAGVALGSTQLPAASAPSFELEPGSMEIGMGIHGEPGVRRVALASADEISAELIEMVTSDLELSRGDLVEVVINGLGATSGEELYILANGALRELDRRGVRVRRTRVGEFATSLEMAGASISLLRLDHELSDLLARETDAPVLDRS